MTILKEYQQKRRGQQEHVAFTLIMNSNKIKPQIQVKPGAEKQIILLKEIEFSSTIHQSQLLFTTNNCWHQDILFVHILVTVYSFQLLNDLADILLHIVESSSDNRKEKASCM